MSIIEDCDSSTHFEYFDQTGLIFDPVFSAIGYFDHTPFHAPCAWFGKYDRSISNPIGMRYDSPRNRTACI
jgi:hypothetical protein